MTQQGEHTVRSRPMTAPLESIPLPDLERVPDYERGFWEGSRNGELRIQRCLDCGLFRHLPTPMCPECSSLDYNWTRVSGRGFVYSYVIVRHPVHPAIHEKEQTPYNLCVIELEEQEGLRICSNILQVAPRGHQHRHAGSGYFRSCGRRSRGSAAVVPARPGAIDARPM